MMAIQPAQQKAVINFIRSCTANEGDCTGLITTAVASIKRSDVLVQLTSFQNTRKHTAHRSIVLR